MWPEASRYARDGALSSPAGESGSWRGVKGRLEWKSVCDAPAPATISLTVSNVVPDESPAITTWASWPPPDGGEILPEYSSDPVRMKFVESSIRMPSMVCAGRSAERSGVSFAMLRARLAGDGPFPHVSVGDRNRDRDSDVTSLEVD